MTTTKIVVALDAELLTQLDQFVAQRVFLSRSKAIEEALRDKLARVRRSRLARECAKLDLVAEQALAEEGMNQELASWPQY